MPIARGPPRTTATAVAADGLGGGRVLAAHAPIGSLGWLVFVERPAADAYAPLRAPIIRSVVIFVLGLGLSILASLLLARRMVRPIRVLQEGATRIGAGRLDQPIELRTGDEIEALAGSFNRMAASLKESYEGLEQKVEARTRELANANRDLTELLEQQTATSEILRVISQSPTDISPCSTRWPESAARLCGRPTTRSSYWCEGSAAASGCPPRSDSPAVPSSWSRSVRGTVSGRAMLERAGLFMWRTCSTEAHDFHKAVALPASRPPDARSRVPMLRDGEPIGTISAPPSRVAAVLG